MTEIKVNPVRFLFNGSCILGAVYMVVLYVSRFYKNEDISSISFRQFRTGLNFDYPRFTICLTDAIFHKGDMFKSTVETVYNVTKTDFMAYMKGDIKGTKQLSQIEYAEVIKQPEEFVIDFHTRDIKNNEFNTWTTDTFIKNNVCWQCRNRTYLEAVVNKSSFLFVTSYSDSEQVCITKNIDFDPKADVRFDQITFDLRKLKGFSRFDGNQENSNALPGRPQRPKPETIDQHNSGIHRRSLDIHRRSTRASIGQIRNDAYKFANSPKTNQVKENNGDEDSFFNSKMKIYLHDPGQLIQNFNNDFTEYDVKALDYSNSNNLIAIRLQQVTRLHKRADAIEKCDASLKDEDYKFLDYVTDQTGCVPPFWKSTMANKSISLCSSQEQFRSIYEHVMDKKRIAKLYLPGCKQTTILALSESSTVKPENFMMLRFFYQPKTFTEIYNAEAVGFESFWGGVGGFVGIFLGFSLMQIPDLISFQSFRKYMKDLQH